MACDVLICGLGPVGQLLALLLGRQGMSVVAIDRASEPYELPRAAVVDDEVLRIFQAAGVDREVLADAQEQDGASFVDARGRAMRVFEPLESELGHPALVSIHQPSMERTLLAALEERGEADLRWGHCLVSFEQRAASVVAEVAGGTGGPETIEAKWLVGCDGGRSTVREALGIAFGGSTFRQRWLVVDALVDRPVASAPHPHFIGDPARPAVSVPMSPGRHRWEWMLTDDEDEAPFLQADRIDELMAPWIGDERAEVERAVVYTFHARTADRWRDGRVLLAGDAAHVMPPFAGQGFSSGARDAGNLAWKLAAVLEGAPEALLDTYEGERRPHVKGMQRLAVTWGGIVQTDRPGVARARDGLLGLLDRSGSMTRIFNGVKPLPTYRRGAFAARPGALPWRRSAGSLFPQPAVSAEGEAVRLDGLLGDGWAAIASAADAEALDSAGLRVLVPGRDVSDDFGGIDAWLGRHGATWAILRPDRFVFACGGAGETGPALAALDATLGPARRDREGVPA